MKGGRCCVVPCLPGFPLFCNLLISPTCCNSISLRRSVDKYVCVSVTEPRSWKTVRVEWRVSRGVDVVDGTPTPAALRCSAFVNRAVTRLT